MKTRGISRLRTIGLLAVAVLAIAVVLWRMASVHAATADEFLTWRRPVVETIGAARLITGAVFDADRQVQDGELGGEALAQRKTQLLADVAAAQKRFSDLGEITLVGEQRLDWALANIKLIGGDGMLFSQLRQAVTEIGGAQPANALAAADRNIAGMAADLNKLEGAFGVDPTR